MAKRGVMTPLARNLSAVVVILLLLIPGRLVVAALPVSAGGESLPSLAPVSYTHLTLPTIYSV